MTAERVPGAPGTGPRPATSPTPETAPGGPRDGHGDELLRVDDLKVYFPINRGVIVSRHVGDVHAVDGVSLTIRKGETLGLVGESGCGKSTTGRAIVRLYKPTAGRIVFDGADITRLEGAALRRTRRRMQMVFQDPYASLNPRMTVAGIVGEPLDIHGIGTRDERRRRVRELFEVVGLDPDYGDRYPHEFSGGQRQRVGVARALAVNPDLIVADEPISALDVSIQAQIINLLERLQAKFGLTYLFIAHDLSVVQHISDRIAVMYLGRIMELAAARELHDRPLHPYSIALLSAVPIPDPAVEQHRRRVILKGDVPSPASPPPGCPFHTRCWLRERLGNPQECETIVPPLAEYVPAHFVACHFANRVEGTPEATPPEELAAASSAAGARNVARGAAGDDAGAIAGSGAAPRRTSDAMGRTPGSGGPVDSARYARPGSPEREAWSGTGRAVAEGRSGPGAVDAPSESGPDRPRLGDRG